MEENDNKNREIVLTCPGNEKALKLKSHLCDVLGETDDFVKGFINVDVIGACVRISVDKAAKDELDIAAVMDATYLVLSETVA